MTRQYLIFGALIVMAVLVLTSVDWGSDNARSLEQMARQSTTGPAQAGQQNNSLNSNSLSTGMSGGFNAASTFKSMRTESLNSEGTNFNGTATSSPFTAATSTAFQAYNDPQNPFASGGENDSGSIRYIELPKRVEQNLSKPVVNKRTDKPIAKQENKRESGEKDKSNPEQKEKQKEEVPAIISDVILSGHVVNEGGTSIQGLGLSLKLIQAVPEDKELFANRALNANTNEQGFYAFINIVEGDYQVCTVAGAGYQAVCQRKHAPNTAADFALRSTSNGRVSGVVKNEQGESLSDVSVSAAPRQSNRGRTDDKGQFDLAMSVNANLNYHVYFTKKDFERQNVAVKGKDILSHQRIEVEMKRTNRSGFEVTGSVFDESGSPLRGHTVRLTSPTLKLGYPLRGTSAKDGAFVIKDVQAANDYRLTVSTKGYQFDGSQFQNMEVYEGMAALSVRLQKIGTGSLTTRVVKRDNTPVVGASFRISSGGKIISSTSDALGVLVFEDVPATIGKASLRIINTTSPQYSFSGIKLVPGEHKPLQDLVVDLGENALDVAVVNEAGASLAGAKGSLTWSQKNNGISSSTTRSTAKILQVDTGLINFKELGGGAHTLTVSLPGYKSHSEIIEINQLSQTQKVTLIKK